MVIGRIRPPVLFCKEGVFAGETEDNNSTVNSTNDSQGSDLLGNASCPLLFKEHPMSLNARHPHG
jgi:hypothetical protein